MANCCLCEDANGPNVYEEDGKQYPFCDVCIEWFKIVKKSREDTPAPILLNNMRVEIEKIEAKERYRVQRSVKGRKS